MLHSSPSCSCCLGWQIEAGDERGQGADTLCARDDGVPRRGQAGGHTWSTSTSFQTTVGLLPPSSSVTGLRLRPAASPISRPTSVLPVNEIC